MLQKAWEGIAEASAEKDPLGALLGMPVALQFTQILEPFAVGPPPEVADLQVTTQVSLKNFVNAECTTSGTQRSPRRCYFNVVDAERDGNYFLAVSVMEWPSVYHKLFRNLAEVSGSVVGEGGTMTC